MKKNKISKRDRKLKNRKKQRIAIKKEMLRKKEISKIAPQKTTKSFDLNIEPNNVKDRLSSILSMDRKVKA